jgi:chitodextrinase
VIDANVPAINILPAWTAASVYNTGNQVSYQGSTWRALWRTQNQKPGDPTGPWEQIIDNPDGTAVWTATRVFNVGDEATYQGPGMNLTAPAQSGWVPWLPCGVLGGDPAAAGGDGQVHRQDGHAGAQRG